MNKINWSYVLRTQDYAMQQQHSKKKATNTILHACVHSRLLQVFVTPELNTTQRQNLHQSISLTKAQKALEAHSCKSWVTNLSIVPHA